MVRKQGHLYRQKVLDGGKRVKLVNNLSTTKSSMHLLSVTDEQIIIFNFAYPYVCLFLC